MLHAACTLGNWVDSQLLVVKSQTTSLTPDLSFDHNLCFRCPNGQCEPILDIYTSIAFQWYKKIYKKMGFDPCNCALRIRDSIWDSNSQHGSSHTLCTPRSMWCDSRVSFLARNLATPCLGHKPKARVATTPMVLTQNPHNYKSSNHLSLPHIAYKFFSILKGGDKSIHILKEEWLKDK